MNELMHEHHGWQNDRRSAVEEVSSRLDNCRYLLIPESAIGSVGSCHNAKGELRPEAVEITIPDISDLIYLEKMEFIGEVANGSDDQSK
jgi:hypothetical protein